MLLGLRSGLVKTYDVEQSAFVDERDCDVKDTHFTDFSVTIGTTDSLENFAITVPPFLGGHITFAA